MRNVATKKVFKKLICTALAGVFSGCFSSSPVKWTNLTTSYHLAFVNYNTPTTLASTSSMPPVQVAIENSLSKVIPNLDPYTVTLSTYSDSQCTQAVNLGGTTNSVGTAVTQSNGTAAINLGGGGNDNDGGGNNNGGSGDGGGGGSPVPGVAYYFKATTTGGIASACSSSLTFSSVNSPLNLVVPIEMLDAPIMSTGTTPTPIFRSQTTLNTNDYDGTVSYFFEYVHDVNGGTLAQIVLEDTLSNPYASVTIPHDMSPTTARVSFTPAPGLTTYRININGISGSVLKVYAARIIVQQSGATKTKIYIPLLAGDSTSSSVTDTSGILTGANIPYGAPSGYTTPIWMPNSAYASLLGANPWSLEAVMSTTGGPANLALYDTTTPGPVSQTEVGTSQAAPTLVTTSFPDSALTQGHSYQLVGRTLTGSYYIHRAGLWVSLYNLTKAEIYNRFMAATPTGVSATNSYDQQRIYIDASLYSHPNFSLETSSYLSTGSCMVGLTNCLSSTTSTGGCTGAGSVSFNWGAASVTRTRSSQFSLTGNDYYIFSATPSGGTLYNASTYLVISISK
jgi:hypothetical protein